MTTSLFHMKCSLHLSNYFSKAEGYDSYDWPADFYPGDDVSTCGQIPPDGRGVPEQVCGYYLYGYSFAFSFRMIRAYFSITFFNHYFFLVLELCRS